MALHDSLRELVTVRGPGVVDEAEELRGALDDFLAEDEATLGELNLLVDAVRLGALRRVLDVMDHGAEPEAAIREAGGALARDRGTDDPTRSCWALATLGFALGKVDESMVRMFRGDAGTMPAPHPPTGPHGRAPEAAPSGPADFSTADRPPTRVISEETPTSSPPTPPPIGSQPTPPPPPISVQPPAPTVEVHAPPPLPKYVGPVPPVVPEEKKPSRAGSFVLVVLVALLLGGLIAAGYILLRSDGDDDPTASDDPTTAVGSDNSGGQVEEKKPVPKDAMLVPYVENDVSRIFQVDATTGRSKPLTPEGVDAKLPTISPDRTTMTYQVGRSPTAVMAVDLATGEQRALFDPDGPCGRAGRPAWSPDGSRLVMLCDADGDEETDGIWLSNADGSGVTGPVVDNPEVGGSPTWISATEFVYGVDDPDTDTTYWRTDVEGGSGVQLPIDIEGHLSHIDWSSEAGRLLVLVSPGDEEEGAIWTVDVDGLDPVLVGEGPFAHPVWSPDGDAIAATLRNESVLEVLVAVPLDDPANPVVVPSPPPGEVGIPVWGTR